jgi:hypothetical protein
MNETEGIERYVLAQESWALALQGVLVLIVGFLNWCICTCEWNLRTCCDDKS